MRVSVHAWGLHAHVQKVQLQWCTQATAYPCMHACVCIRAGMQTYQAGCFTTNSSSSGQADDSCVFLFNPFEAGSVTENHYEKRLRSHGWLSVKPVSAIRRPGMPTQTSIKYLLNTIKNNLCYMSFGKVNFTETPEQGMCVMKTHMPTLLQVLRY